MDRTAKFAARVKAHLDTLPEAKKLSFVQAQLRTWEDRYNHFIATEGKSEPVTDKANPPQAADFLATVLMLCALKDALTQKVAA